MLFANIGAETPFPDSVSGLRSGMDAFDLSIFPSVIGLMVSFTKPAFSLVDVDIVLSLLLQGHVCAVTTLPVGEHLIMKLGKLN